MECPRCKSTRIQRGYRDAPILLRLGGGHELLCNNCGLEFKRFKWAATFQRIPVNKSEPALNRRHAPRYKAHLPVMIRLVDKATGTGPSVSPAAHGHCQTISTLGMALSFVGSRFDQVEFAEPGRFLLVVVNLPGGAVEALVKTITHKRIENPEGPSNWFVGASISQISDADRARLSSYLEKRSNEV